MAAAHEVFAKFSVTSGTLCFGGLHNIWDGASVAAQAGFPDIQRNHGGTVKAQRMQFNIPAQNGIWNAFRLVDVNSEYLYAWFSCHSDVDPDIEVDKILRVSGSPYESESGSHFNNAKTRAEGVFVINRYDWGFYDDRSKEHITDQEEHNHYNEEDFPRVGVGLIDYLHAKSQVSEWQSVHSGQRRQSDAGIWMDIPNAEYEFGRFGFDDARVSARSFLFFAQKTTFTETKFAGAGQTLRKFETSEEWWERKVREGYAFSGLERLSEMSAPIDETDWETGFPKAPPESEMLGPYDLREHVLRPQDIEALRVDVRRSIERSLQQAPALHPNFAGTFDSTIFPFAEPNKEAAFDLLNELVLTFLERVILPHVSHRLPSEAAEAFFPRHAADNRAETLDTHLYPKFMEATSDDLIPEFDANNVGQRIKSFLQSHSRDGHIPINEECISGICRVVVYITKEIMELANDRTRGSKYLGIVPACIRFSVYNDRQLLDFLQYSAVFWKGRNVHD